jgi:hypothetical protein
VGALASRSKRVKGIPHQVKVHKLNEMGEIVDKKGHRAWDMACGLQLGIRINVSAVQNPPADGSAPQMGRVSAISRRVAWLFSPAFQRLSHPMPACWRLDTQAPPVECGGVCRHERDSSRANLCEDTSTRCVSRIRCGQAPCSGESIGTSAPHEWHAIPARTIPACKALTIIAVSW